MDKLMTPYWEKCVTFLPMWMAPNLVTLIGFMGVVVNVLVFLPYDLSLTMAFHPFLYVVTGLVIFMYQTFDAIDGK